MSSTAHPRATSHAISLPPVDNASPIGDPAPLPSVPTPQRYAQPRRLLVIVAVAVFVSEAIIMVLLRRLALPAEELIDALMITLVLVTLLDRFMLRPLRHQIAERERAEARVAQSNQELLALSQLERSQHRTAEALAEATTALNSSLDLDEVLDRILEQMRRVLSCRAAAIMQLENEWVTIARHQEREGPWLNVDLRFPVDRFEGLRELLESQSPSLISDATTDARWPAIESFEWVRSLVLVPLVAKGVTQGFLLVLSDQVDAFRSDLTRFLVSFAACAAVALHRAGVYRSEQRARLAAETLAAESLSLAQSLELETVLDLLLSYIYRLVPYDHGSVALLESETQLVVKARASFDESQSEDSGLGPVLDVSLHPDLELLIETRRTTTGSCKDAYNCAATVPKWITAGCTCSWLVVPLVVGEHTLGICFLGRSALNDFAPDELQLAEAIISQGAVALQNAWLFQQIRAGRERLQLLSHRLVQVQENERTFVARELHDEAGQALASMLLSLHQIERNAQYPDRVREGLQEVRQIANSVQEELHRLAVNLRPASLDHLGLEAALKTFLDRLSGSQGLRVQFKVTGSADTRLNPEIEIALYRIAQEAIANVVRHANATNIAILLRHMAHGVMLTVEDDGIGFVSDKVNGPDRIGLIGMRERCEMLGGHLTVESSPGTGTTVVAEVPYAH